MRSGKRKDRAKKKQTQQLEQGEAPPPLPTDPPAIEEQAQHQAQPVFDSEVVHSMAPGGSSRVPVPSAAFMQRYLKRMEDKQVSDDREPKQALTTTKMDYEAGRSKGAALKQSLDFSTWSRWRIFVGVTLRQHAGLTWLAPQKESRRLVRAMAFWLYVFTHFMLIAWFFQDMVDACGERPVVNDCDCNAIGQIVNGTTSPAPVVDISDCTQYLGVEFLDSCGNCLFEQCTALKRVEEYEACVDSYLLVDTEVFKLEWFKAFTVVMTELLSAILMVCYNSAFSKMEVKDYRTLAEKRRIIVWWKGKELFGLIFAALWIAFCCLYLFQFILNQKGDTKAQFTAMIVTGVLTQALRPFITITGIWILLFAGKSYPMGRFLLTLFPRLYSFKHVVVKDPEDFVVTARERRQRKAYLRKQTHKLRQTARQRQR